MPPSKKTLKHTQISKEAFNAILSRYPSTVPEELRDLDALRYDTIPATVTTRAKKSPYLTKDEVEKLVEWKLKHGTFRPKLLQLVQSNSAKDIEKATRKAFSIESGFDEDVFMFMHRDDPVNALAPLACKALTLLKGVGPATASLLLSTGSTSSIPFFSDELFRWTMWDSSGNPGGWSRPIKYTAKEYEELLKRFNALQSRLGVRAADAEKVAWVLGREGVDVGKDGEEYLRGMGGEGEARNESVVGGESAVAAKGKKGRKRKSVGMKEGEDREEDVGVGVGEEDVGSGRPKKGVKRKAGEAKAPAEGVRRSTRRKTAA